MMNRKCVGVGVGICLSSLNILLKLRTLSIGYYSCIGQLMSCVPWNSIINISSFFGNTLRGFDSPIESIVLFFVQS